MGYYTNYSIDVMKDPAAPWDAIPHSLNYQLARRLAELSKDEFDIEQVDDDCLHPFEELIENDSRKWYDHYEDMTQLSKEFPELYFCLEGHGEDREDMWREYFHDGKAFHADASITYDRPSWM